MVGHVPPAYWFYLPAQTTSYDSLTTQVEQGWEGELNALNRLTDWRMWNCVQGIWQ